MELLWYIEIILKKIVLSMSVLKNVYVESLVRYQVDTKEYASLTLGLALTKLILLLNVNSHVRKILKSVLMELQR
jgi:hypothetical protein